MDKHTKNTLNPTDAITGSVSKLIEVFVNFYGESERKIITEKFNNMLVIGYIPPEIIRAKINDIKTKKSEEIKRGFLNSFNLEKEQEENLDKLYFKKYELDYENLHPIMLYIKYKSDRKKWQYLKEECVNFLKEMYPSVNADNIDVLIDNNFFEELDAIVNLYQIKQNEYNKFLESIKSYEDYVDACNDLKKLIEKKKTKEMIEELKTLFSSEEYDNIQKEFNKEKFFNIQNVNAKTKNYFSYSLEGTPLIEAFSLESEQILKTDSEWRKESVKKDRIRYFENMGLVLGGDYEEYMNHPRAKEIIPPIDLVEKIVKTKKRYSEEAREEYFTSIPEYINNRNRIDKLDLLDKSDCYDAKLYEENGTAVATNIKYENGKIISKPLLLFGINYMYEYLDHRLIHELNHIYELSLLESSEEYYKCVCGWDETVGNLSTKTYFQDEEKRKYELFNEIINELIAQEISATMSDLDIYIFNNKDNKKIKNGTGYEKTRVLVEDFYNTYKKEIIESRKQGNILIIYEAVGKDNFESLNNLINEYENAFPGISIYNMYRELKENKKTPGVILYKDLLERRDQILSNMNECYINKNKI